jgi:hypothetical protein
VIVAVVGRMPTDAIITSSATVPAGLVIVIVTPVVKLEAAARR